MKELAPLAGEGIGDEDVHGRNCLDIAKDEEYLSVALYLASSFPALMRKVRLTYSIRAYLLVCCQCIME